MAVYRIPRDEKLLEKIDKIKDQELKEVLIHIADRLDYANAMPQSGITFGEACNIAAQAIKNRN